MTGDFILTMTGLGGLSFMGHFIVYHHLQNKLPFSGKGGLKNV